jgi:hypothetical protein
LTHLPVRRSCSQAHVVLKCIVSLVGAISQSASKVETESSTSSDRMTDSGGEYTCSLAAAKPSKGAKWEIDAWKCTYQRSSS